MFILLILCLYIFLSTLAFGHLLTTLVFKKMDLPFDILSLLGFMGLTCLLNVAHLFVPLGGILPHLLCLLVISIFYKRIRQSVESVSIPKIDQWTCVFGVFPFLTILLVVAIEPFIFDSISYHVQIMRWFEKYAVVPGLANIHARLAVNSILYPTMVFFDFSFANGQAYFPVNGYFCFLIFARLFIEIKNDWQQKQYHFVRFELLLVLSILYFYLCKFLASPSPDFLANTFIFYLFIFIKKRDTPQYGGDILLIVISIFLPLIKLSQIFLVFTPLFFIKEKRLWLTYFAVGLTLGVPFIAHNAIQSGYLFFPAPYLNILNVDWKLPLNMSLDPNLSFASVNGMNMINMSWGRIPFEPFEKVMALSFFDWLPIWAKANMGFQNILLVFALFSPFLSLWAYRKTKKGKRWLCFGFICWCNSIFWLFTAPDFRFGYGYLWSAAFLPILFLNLPVETPPQYISRFLPIFVLILFIFTFRPAWKNFYAENQFSMKDIVYPHTIPYRKTIEKKCTNFKIQIATEMGQCGCQEVPCAPYFQSNLEMRGKDYSDGFRLKK